MCIETGNASCIFGSILYREKTALGLTETGVDALVRDYVLPSYGKVTGFPRTETVVGKESGVVQSVLTWTVPGHPPVKMASTAAITPDGAMTICTTQWMIFNAMDARYRRSPNEEGIVVYLRGLEHDSARLTQLGIPGIYDPRKDEVIKWPELIEKYRREIDEAGLNRKG